MSLQTAVKCDGCETTLATAGNGFAARLKAATAGAVTGLKGGRDLCVECRQAEEA